MKKLISVILSMAMVLCMTVTGFAEGGYTITIDNPEKGHTYDVYQIFKGDLSGNTLSNIEWGTGVSATYKDGKDAATIAEGLTTANAAEKFAADIVANGLGTSIDSLSSDNTTAPNLVAGYYLIKDRAINDNSATYILKVVKDVTVKPKRGDVTVEKKVKDTNDSTGETTDWQDSADYDIGDEVPFKLTAKLPGNVESYKTYKVIFHDTLSAGFTYNNNAVIKIDGKVVTDKFTITSQGTALTFSCNDVKGLGATNNSEITVEYSANLDGKDEKGNSLVVIGSTGNPNKVKLEYSSNPDYTGEGEEETEETPEDTVIVFTYQTIINKVDPDKKPLTGAEFTLEKKQADGRYKEIAVIKNDEGTTFTFKGLDDGEYRLRETKTPAGYNTMKDVVFTITAKHDVLSDNPQLTELNGDPTSGTIEFTSSTTEGSLTADVVNNQGTELPETGGIGTKIFYVVGAALVIGAGVLLITRKRMSTR